MLAGGDSSRMGKEKGLCLFNGKPLITYVTGILEEICDTVLISANRPDYEFLGFRIIPDEIRGKGPAAGIYSCLNASETMDNLILSCDTPLISPELLKSLLEAKERHQAVIPVHDGLTEPLCGYYNKQCAPIFLTSINAGRFKILDILKDLDCLCYQIDTDHSIYEPFMFKNANTPDDLQSLEKILNDDRHV